MNRATVLAATLFALPLGSPGVVLGVDWPWNLLGLTGGARPAAEPVDPAVLLIEAQTLFNRDTRDADAKAEDYLNKYFDRAAPTAGEEERRAAGLLLARIIARTPPSEDRDASRVERGLRLLQGHESQEASAARGKLRAVLAKKELFISRFYARKEAWPAAEARLTNFERGFADLTGEEGIRDYLRELQRTATAPNEPEGPRRAVALAARRLLETQPPPAPAALVPSSIPALKDKAGLLSTQMADAAAQAKAFDGTGSNLSIAVELRNGEVRKLEIRNPASKTALEVGQIGIGSRSGIIVPSPYINLRKEWESSEYPLWDYRVRAQAAYLSLRGRFFGDDSAAPSAKIPELAARLGLPGAVAATESVFAVKDPYREEGTVIASVMPQLGRAYSLFNPFFGSVDAGWALTNITKIAYIAPNTVFDATGGLRLRFDRINSELGLFAGLSRNFSPIGNRLLGDLIKPQGVRPGLYMEDSPHWTAAASAPAPGLVDGRLEAGVSQRFNKDTREDQLQAGLRAPLNGKPLELRLGYDREQGPLIEYDRQRARLEAAYSFMDQATVFASCHTEKIRFGNADLSNDGCLAGLTFRPAPNASARADFLLDGKDRLLPVSESQAASIAAGMSRLIAKGVEFADSTVDLLRAQEFLRNLTPQERLALEESLDGLSLTLGQKEIIKQWINTDMPANAPALLGDARRKDYLEVARLLSDPALWDNAARCFIRARIMEGLGSVRIPIKPLGVTLQLTPASVLSMAAVVQSRSPLAPLTGADGKAIERFMLDAGAKELGLPAGAGAEAITGKLIDLAEIRLQDAVRLEVQPRIDQLIAAGILNGPDAAAAIKSALPPALYSELEKRLGPNLGLPDNAQTSDLRALADTFPALVSEAMRGELGADVARLLADTVAWLAEVWRREINLMTIRLLLVSEEINQRITVDEGLKAGHHGTMMVARAFSNLDKRKRDVLGERLKTLLGQTQSLAEDQKSVSLEQSHAALARLKALSLEAGLRLEISQRHWSALLSAYGPEQAAALLLKTANDQGRGLPELKIEFDPGMPGVTIWKDSSGHRIVIGPPLRTGLKMLK